MDVVIDSLPSVALEAVCIVGFSVMYIKVHRLKYELSQKCFGYIDRKLRRLSNQMGLADFFQRKCQFGSYFATARFSNSDIKQIMPHPEELDMSVSDVKEPGSGFGDLEDDPQVSGYSASGTESPLPNLATIVCNMPLDYICAEIYFETFEKLARKRQKTDMVSVIQVIQDCMKQQKKMNQTDKLPLDIVEELLRNIGVSVHFCRMTEGSVPKRPSQCSIGDGREMVNITHENCAVHLNADDNYLPS